METIQKTRSLLGKAQRNKGCRTSSKRKMQERTALPITNGFLKCRFVPMVMGKAYLMGWKQAERDFFRSYHHYVTSKGITPVDYRNKVFPYNIALAYRQLKVGVEQEHTQQEILITENNKSSCCITTVETLDTNMTLYYIPLRPLQRLQHDKSKRGAYNLLMSVCSYLLKVVRLPFYKHGDYVADCYERLKDWTESETEAWFDETDFNAALSDFKEADYYGYKLNRQLSNTCHLQQWQERMEVFNVNDMDDAALYMVADEAYQLFHAYPKQRFYDNINPELFFPNEEERTRPDQYISFTWSESGWLYEQLFEMVNTDLQENGIADEPLLVQTFDADGGRLINNLDFEKRLFALLNHLSEILYSLSDE